MAAVKRGRGRPTLYTPELADEICERVALGETTIAISRDEHMPDRTVMFRWAQANPEFSQRIHAARVESVHTEFEEIRDIADQQGTNRDVVARRAQQIDARKFRCARLSSRYTEKHNLAVSTPEPLNVQAAIDLSKLTPEEQAVLRDLSRKALQGSK